MTSTNLGEEDTFGYSMTDGDGYDYDGESGQESSAAAESGMENGTMASSTRGDEDTYGFNSVDAMSLPPPPPPVHSSMHARYAGMGVLETGTATEAFSETESVVENEVIDEAEPIQTEDECLSFESDIQEPPPPPEGSEVQNVVIPEAAEEYDDHGYYSLPAANEYYDDVSTLGDTIGGSTLGGSTNAGVRALRTMNSLECDLEDPIDGYANTPMPRNGEDYQDEDEEGLNFPYPWKSKKEDGPPIEIVSTQDSSNEIDDSVTAKASRDNTEAGFNYQRLAYLTCLIMGPVLFAAIIALSFLLIDMRGSKDSNAVIASSTAVGNNIPDWTALPSQLPAPRPTLRPNSSGTESPSTLPPMLSTVAPTKNPDDKKPPKDPKETPSPTLQPSSTPVLAVTLAPTPLPLPATTATPTVLFAPVATPSPTSLPITQTPTVALVTPAPTVAPVIPPPVVAPVIPPPVAAPVIPPTITFTQLPTQQPVEVPTVEVSPIETMALPPFPEGRFVSWSSLMDQADDDDSDWFLSAISSMGFSESTWDVPHPDQGPNSLSFQQARSSSGSADSALFGMGIRSAASWNCWVNHYYAMDWDELGQLPGPNDGQFSSDTVGFQTNFGFAIQQAYTILGWSSDRWTEDQSGWPESEFKDWDELSSAEQEAAKQACWTRNLWDKNPIPSW
jgi:hypothetical protein